LVNFFGIFKLLHLEEWIDLEFGMLSLGEFSQETGHQSVIGEYLGWHFTVSAIGGADFTPLKREIQRRLSL
jgi:hypothetical protein